MTTSCTIKFPQGTPETLITEALDSLPLLDRLLSTNRSFIELEVSKSLLDLKERLGEKIFNSLTRNHSPLAAKEINQKLAMAELKQNLERTGKLTPSLYNALINLGMEASAALTKGSEELASYLINTVSQVAGVSKSTITALVRRERKGFNPLPTPKEIAIFQPSVLVTVTKNGKHKNWVAEVMEEPDALGRVQVMMLKTNRKSTLFWWEIEPHQLTTPDAEDEIPVTELEPIIKEFVVEGGDDKYYPIPMYDVQRVKNRVQTLATLDGGENTQIKIKWRHLLEATEQYHFIPAVSILQLTDAVSPTSQELEPSQQLTGTHTGFPEENLKLIRSLKNYWQQITAINQEIERSILSDTRAHLMQIRHNTQCRFEQTLNALFSSVVFLPEEPVHQTEPVEYLEPVDEPMEYLMPVDEDEPMEYLEPVEYLESVDETEPVEYLVPAPETEVGEYLEPVDETEIGEYVESVDEAESLNYVEPLIETEPVEYLKPMDEEGPVIKTEPVELRKQVEGPLYQFQRKVGYPCLES